MASRVRDLAGAPANPRGKGRQVRDQGGVHALHPLSELCRQLYRVCLPGLLPQIAGDVLLPDFTDALGLKAAHELADAEGGHALSGLCSGPARRAVRVEPLTTDLGHMETRHLG